MLILPLCLNSTWVYIYVRFTLNIPSVFSLPLSISLTSFVGFILSKIMYIFYNK